MVICKILNIKFLFIIYVACNKKKYSSRKKTVSVYSMDHQETVFNYKVIRYVKNIIPKPSPLIKTRTHETINEFNKSTLIQGLDSNSE